VKFSRFYRK